MASMTCTTRETVTRTLGQFRKDGWISIEDSMVTLHQSRPAAKPAGIEISQRSSAIPQVPASNSLFRSHSC
jgi:hypothetical protein